MSKTTSLRSFADLYGLSSDVWGQAREKAEGTPKNSLDGCTGMGTPSSQRYRCSRLNSSAVGCVRKLPVQADSRINPRVIAFDGDDTLWHCESYFDLAEQRLQQLLGDYRGTSAIIKEHLYQVEMRNLHRYGYGAKGFTLSMIQTALEVSEGRIAANEVDAILEIGHFLMSHPIEPLPGVKATLEKLGQAYELLLVTKGDLFDQEGKLARSGLGDLFSHVEIVSEKDVSTYRRIFNRYEVAVGEFVMIGNSLRSDISPVLELGASAIHVPYHLTWKHETELRISSETRGQFAEVRAISEVPEVIARFASAKDEKKA